MILLSVTNKNIPIM